MSLCLFARTTLCFYFEAAVFCNWVNGVSPAGPARLGTTGLPVGRCVRTRSIIADNADPLIQLSISCNLHNKSSVLLNHWKAFIVKQQSLNSTPEDDETVKHKQNEHFF